MAMPQTYAPGEFPVPVVRTLPMGDACVSETVYGPGCRLPRHAHERACFVLVLAGNAEPPPGRERRP